MGIKRLILRNVWIKVSSILLSIVLWTYIWGERKANNEIMGEIVQKEFSAIPLSVLKDPGSPLEANVSHEKVSMVIEAERDIAQKLDRNGILAYIDIRDLGTGVYRLPPTWNIPLGIKIVASHPEFVTVSIEDKRIIEVPPLVAPVPEKKKTEVLESIK